METLQRKSGKSWHGKELSGIAQVFGASLCRFMYSLGSFQAACKQFSVNAGLGPFVGNCPCHALAASGFPRNFKGFAGASFENFVQLRATFRHFLRMAVYAPFRQYVHIVQN